MELIVAYDATPESTNALQSALQLSERIDGTVTALHSVEQTVIETDGGYPVIEGPTSADDRAERILGHALDVASEWGFNIKTDIVRGNPVESLIEYASEKDEATIYVGHRTSMAARPSVGSVAQRLIRESPVPVTVVT